MILPGAPATLVGLQNRPELNGTRGVVLRNITPDKFEFQPVSGGSSFSVRLKHLRLTNALDAAVRQAGGGLRWEDVETPFATRDRTLLKMTEVAQRMFGYDGTLTGSVCKRGVCAAAIADMETRLQGGDVEAGTEYDAQASGLDVFVVAAENNLGTHAYSGRHGLLRKGRRVLLDTGEVVHGLTTQPLPKGGQYAYFATREQQENPLEMPIRFVEHGQAGFEEERDKFVREAGMRYCVETPVTRTLEIEGAKMLEIDVVVHKFYAEKHTHVLRATGEENELDDRVTMQPLHLLGVCLANRSWAGQWPDMMYVQIIRKTRLSTYQVAVR